MNASFLRLHNKTLRRLLIPVFFFMFATSIHAQLIAWDASASSGYGVSPLTPGTLNANLTMVSGLIRGSSISTSGTAAGGCWGGSGGWGTTDAGSIYFTFRANTGYAVSLSSISAKTRRSGSGPTNNNIEYSINGGAYVVLANWTTSSTSGTTGTSNSTSLSGVAALQNVAAGTTIRFRMSFPGSPANNFYLTGSAGTALVLNGTVVPVPTCTVPTGLVASNVTTTSADLDWDAITGITGYEYVIDQTAAVPAGTGTAVTTNSYAATGLNPATVYYAHVRTNCSGSTFSTWATTSFTTAAGCVSPSITAVTSNTALCVGSPLTLSVTATGSSLSYTWTGAGTFGSANTNTTSVTNVSSSDYTVSISNACGTVSAVVSVTVNALPSVTSNSLVTCAGSTGTLTASGANTYTWSTGQTSASATVNPISSSVYTVTGTDLNGCKNTYTTAVTVNVLPTVTANSPSVCAGSTTTLTAGGATTYTWSTTEAATSVTLSPTATTVYTVTGTDLNGCVNTKTTQVTVNALPPVTANSPAVCAGSTTTLTASGATTYTWNGTQASASMTVNPTGTTMYTVTGTDLNGCENTFSTWVTVYALPTIIANSPSVCAGGTTTLTASGANTYTWNATQAATSITVSPSANTAYTVTGTDLSGCESMYITQVTVNGLPSVSANAPSVCAGGTTTLTATGAATYTWSTTQAVASITVNPTANTVYTVTGTDLNGCANTFTTQVTMSAAPVITVNSSTICTGATGTLTASGVSTYTWSTGSNSNSVTASPTAATVYTVSGNLAGCPAVVSTTAAITVNTLPSVSITPVGTALCNTTGTVNLAGIPFGGTFTGVGIVGNVFSPQTAGTGTFVVSYSYTGTNACAGIAHTNIVVANCTGIEEIAGNLAFEVYPNPATDEVQVKFPGTEPRTISIYSMNGALVYSEQISALQHTLHLGELSKGLYVLKVSGTDGQSSKRILLQ
jgi:hypothetical protein